MSKRIFGWSFHSSNYDMSSNDDEVKVIWVRKCFPSGACDDYDEFFLEDKTKPASPLFSRRPQTPTPRTSSESCVGLVEVKRLSASLWKPCTRLAVYTDDWGEYDTKNYCRYHLLRRILTPLSVGGEWCDNWLEEWYMEYKAAYYSRMKVEAEEESKVSRKKN